MELIFPIYLYRKLEKIFLSETTGPISIYLGRNVSLVTLYQDCSSCHDLSKNMAGRGGAYFPSIYLYKKLEKIFLSETTGSILNITWQICFLGDPYQDFFQAIMICQKTWLVGGRGLFSPYIYIENFNDLLVRNHWTDFNLTLQKCFFCNPLSRLCKPSWFIKKQGRQEAGLIFPI